MITYYKALDKWLLKKPGRKWMGTLDFTTYGLNVDHTISKRVIVIHAKTLCQMNWTN